MKKIFNNVCKYLKKVKNEHLISTYIKENPLFIIYIIINVINSTMLRFFTMHSLENYLSIKPILADNWFIWIFNEI